MKTKNIVKASLFTLILAFMAIGTVAIAKEVMKKENSNQNETTKEVVEIILLDTWYFHGSDSPTNVKNPALYQDSPSSKNCGPLQTICSINAPEDTENPGYPDMNYEVEPGVTVSSLIEQARASKTPNEVVNDFREL